MERELAEIMRYTGQEKAEVVRRLLELGIAEWRKRHALDLLRDGQVTFAKAASLAKMDLWEFAELIRQRGIVWMRSTQDEVGVELRHLREAETT